MHSENLSELTHKALLKVRQKLLYLSKRNRLLNFKETARSIRIIDELPDQVFKTLVTEAKSMSLVPIEEIEDKDIKTLAPLNQNTEKEGKTTKDKPNDLCLQTPYTSTFLERRCKRIYLDARTAIEETGSNFLHLCIGFLEWYEDDNSDISYKAPLILIPVQLERWKIDRKNNCYSYTEEDIETNLSLALKLSNDFDLTLPELDDQISPDEYLNQVSQLISHKKRWRIVREMVIGMFSFAKILMYKDLDPDKWPNGFKITEHEKIREILKTKETFSDSDNILYEEEYDIDEDKTAEKIPLILDADSSQHSAIIDALFGKDLVVEGPPGTGKSQTITNLIASALYEGKSVLFVAEKKAALEVVRRRLDQAGLGDFCLEIHSTKTKKGKLREDIRKRLEKRFKEPKELKYVIEDLTRERDKLRTYASLINKSAGPNCETIYQIMWKAERYYTEISPGQKVFFPIKDALNLSRNDIQERINTLNEFVHLYKELPVFTIKAFSGFKLINLLPGEEQPFKTLLIDLVDSGININKFLSDVINKHNIPVTLTFGTILKISEISTKPITSIPDSFDQDIASRMVNPLFIQVIYKLREAINKYNDLMTNVKRFLRVPKSLTIEQTSNLKDAIESLKSLGYGDYSIIVLENLKNESERAIKLLHNLKIIADTVKGVLIEEIDSIKHFQSLISLNNTMRDAPDDIDVYGHLAHMSPLASQLFHKAKNESTNIKNKISGFSSFFQLSRLPHYKELNQILSDLYVHSRKLFSFLSPTLRKIRRTIGVFIIDKKNVKHPQTISKLYAVAELLENAESIRNNTEYSYVLGPLFKGIETDWGRLEKHISWSQLLRNTTGSKAFSEKIMNNISQCRNLSSKLSQKVENTVKELEFVLEKLRINTGTDISIEDAIKKNQALASKILSDLNTLEPFITNKDITVTDIKAALDDYIDCVRICEKVNKNDQFREYIGPNYKGINTEINNLCILADWVSSLFGESNIPEEIIKWFLEAETASRLVTLVACVKKAGDYVTVHSNTISKVEKIGTFDDGIFLGQPINNSEICKITERYKECMQQLDYLFLWSDFCKAKEKAVSLSIEKIIEAIENGTISPESCIAHCNYSIYSSMARELLRSNHVLSSFTSASYENIRSRFLELDKTIMKLRREEIASKISQRLIPRGIGSGPVGGFTDLSLIKQELNKRKRHIPTRQLIKRAGRALKELKPCFMMSPLSVVQYLIPGEINFDLVIMDEASQIKPEDALGAIARSGKIIIVGDSNQLPPTTFFERINENYENDDELVAIEDTESILDICRTIYISRRLRWHYRSEHESLIAFSNSNFYDNNLIIFPSPHRSNDQLGIRYHYIKDANYSKGKNLIEAQRIVDAIINYFEDSPALSLGVVTFNIEQRDLIEDLLV